jgi:hypothetical protein
MEQAGQRGVRRPAGPGLVIAWQQFMREPRSFFRHLFEEL